MKRDIKKILIKKEDNKAIFEILLSDNKKEILYTGYSSVTGYQIFRMLFNNDFLNVDLDFYSLGFREKNILDNLSVIKKSNDFKNGFIFLSTDKEVYDQNEAFIIADNKIIG